MFWSHQLGNSWSSIIFLTPFLGYLCVLVLCVLISFRTRDLFFQWVCLEINILSVIPLLVVKIREDSVLNGLKYFISQRAASLLFIARVIISSDLRLIILVRRLAILFKLGVPPFHSWLLRILPNLGYIEMFILMRIQKFIPLIILRQLKVSRVILRIIVGRTLIFLFIRLNKVGSLFILLFLSSRSNGLWILRGVNRGGQWIIFTAIYRLILGVSLILLRSIKVYKINDLLGTNYVGAMGVGLQFLNVGGLPPLMGFILKIIMIKVIIHVRLLITIILILRSLLIMYIYTTTLYEIYCIIDSYEFSRPLVGSAAVSILTAFSLLGSGVLIWLI